MEYREFIRFHLLKVLLALVVIQIIIFAIIQNYNHRPETFRDVATVFEGRTVKISPLSNDLDKDITDQLSLSHIAQAKHGVVQHIGNLISYHSELGFSGVDSFSYTITDGHKESKEAWVVVNVIKNLPPVAVRDIFSVYSGSGSVIEILDNDTDPEKDSLFIKKFTQPVYGVLKMSGNKLIYFPNSSSSTKVDSFSYKISDGMHTSEKALVIINIWNKKESSYPWMPTDLGDLSKKGEFFKQGQNIVIKTSGSDIWGEADGFSYVYQYVKGDCVMFTRIESLEAKNDWAKAGIMIRESLTRGSKMTIVCVTPKNGIITHFRSETNRPADNSEAYPNKKAPYWVKIERIGDTINYYASDNRNSWKALGSVVIPMPENVYIGFAVTSHDNNEVCNAHFDNYMATVKPAKL